MAFMRLMREALTGVPYFQETRTGRRFRRVVAALSWPHGTAPGCVLVAGELLGGLNVLNVRWPVHVLAEQRSADVAELVDSTVRLNEDWLISCVITPGDDPHVVFLDAANDDLRRERRRRIRTTDPQEWHGSGERLLSFYLGLLQQRVVGEKTLFFGRDCSAAAEVRRLDASEVDQRMTDTPGAAALLWLVAEIDLNKSSYDNGLRKISGPADPVGGY